MTYPQKYNFKKNYDSIMPWQFHELIREVLHIVQYDQGIYLTTLFLRPILQGYDNKSSGVFQNEIEFVHDQNMVRVHNFLNI